MKKNYNIKIKYLFLALFSVFLWGISLLSTKNLLKNNFTPNNITFFRFFIAGSISYFFLPKKIKKTKIKKIDRKYFLIMSLGGVSLFYYFENTGLKYTTVSNTSLLTATIPLFTLLIAFIFFRKKLLWQNFVGIPLGLLGTFILFYKDIISSGIHLKGDFFVLGSVIMWIIYSFVGKKIMHKYDVSFITYKIFFYGVILLIPILLFEFKDFYKIHLNVWSVVHLLFLSVFCSYFGYFFWNLAIKNIGIKIISNLILFIPIVSIGAAIIFLHEPFTVNLVVATILIMLGAYLTSISGKENNF